MGDDSASLPGPRIRRLRIGFIGNTNNYPFLIANALKQLGHDVTILLDRPEALNKPFGRYKNIDPEALGWICDISDSVYPEGWRLSRSAELAPAKIARYDFLVLNGFGLCLAADSKVPKFALLTGSDLTNLAQWSTVPALWRSLKPSLDILRRTAAIGLRARAVYRQRKAIRSAIGISHFARGTVPEADALLDGMRIPDSRRTYFMLSDVDHIEPSPPPPRINGRIRVFNVARLNWREPRHPAMSSLDMKGSDILLAGFASFLRRYPDGGDLVLVRKGVDVDATRQLAEHLGISRNVLWLDEMPQAEVFEQYRLAHVVTDQFGMSYIGIGALDAMASARPVIANRRPEVGGDGHLDEKSPLLHAATANDVSLHLGMIAESSERAAELSYASRSYVEANHSPGAAAKRLLNIYFAALGAQGRGR